MKSLSAYVASLFLIATASPAFATTYTWDPNGISGLGGSGTWDAGTTASWAAGTGATSSTVVWPNNAAPSAFDANFGNAAGTPTAPGGTVTLGSNVTADSIAFNATSGFTLNGTNTLTLATNTPSSSVAVYVNVKSTNVGNVTINAPIAIGISSDTSGTVVHSSEFENDSTGTLTLNGNITMSDPTGLVVGPRPYEFDAGNGGTIVIAGNLGAEPNMPSATGGSSISLGNKTTNSAATYIVSGNNSSLNAASSGGISFGTALLANNNAMGTGTIVIGATGTTIAKVLTDGAFTIANAIKINGEATATYSLGGATADASSFTGNIAMNNSTTLTAFTGGSVNFSGTIVGSSSVATVSGGGTVELSNGNNTFASTSVTGGTLELAASSTGTTTGVSKGPVGKGVLTLADGGNAGGQRHQHYAAKRGLGQRHRRAREHGERQLDV